MPPQIDSSNNNYVWELKDGEIDDKMKIGLYMNHRSNRQLKPAVIDGIEQKDAYVAFYSYCQYKFNVNDILETTFNRLKREKYFLLIFSILIIGLIASIKLSGRQNSNNY